MSKKVVGQFIIQIAGKPVENVEKALKFVLDKIKKENKKFKLREYHIANPELEDKTTLYSGFLDLELGFNETKDILDFIADYTPTSIEIIEPEKIELNSHDLTGILNDIAHHLLRASAEVRQLRAHVHVLNKEKEQQQTKKVQKK